MPSIDPIVPDKSNDRYDMISFNENGLLVIRDTINDKSMYMNVNFKPSR